LRIGRDRQCHMAAVNIFVFHAKALRAEQEGHTLLGCTGLRQFGKVFTRRTGGWAKIARRHGRGAQVRHAVERLVQGIDHPRLGQHIVGAAGAIINRAALDVEAVRISQKQVNDFVTEVDHASEKIIIETLLTAYPDHGILAEESGSTHGNPLADHIWIIDPLDGTTNFIHGFPVYCVSIALQVRGKIEQAVIYDPTRNDLFTATKGRGAFMNDRRLRVSKRIRMEECIISTGFPFRKGDNFNQYLRMMGDVMQRTAGLRRPGAAALDLAYVAAGFTDGFFETGLSPWDVAAGSLLVTEAGGLIGNFTGESDFLEQKECLAGAPRIYGQMVTILGKYSKFASAGDKANVRSAVDTLSRERTSDQHDLEADGQEDAAAKDGSETKDAPF